jgi:COP9 signalosome complex subunit 6
LLVTYSLFAFITYVFHAQQLAIITMSDHYTRVSTGGGVPSPESKILGILFGVQEGLQVSIFDATEVSYTVTEGRIVVNHDSVDKQKQLYSAVYPTYEVLGWYSVGSEPR